MPLEVNDLIQEGFYVIEDSDTVLLAASGIYRVAYTIIIGNEDTVDGSFVRTRVVFDKESPPGGEEIIESVSFVAVGPSGIGHGSTFKNFFLNASINDKIKLQVQTFGLGGPNILKPGSHLSIEFMRYHPSL